jgi:hypothetical protein
VDEGARPGKDVVRAGGAGHAPQTEPAESEAVSGDRPRPPPAHSSPPPSYLGIFTIEVGANGADEMPPSLLAVTLHTSG